MYAHLLLGHGRNEFVANNIVLLVRSTGTVPTPTRRPLA